jgi:hypothetical protein
MTKYQPYLDFTAQSHNVASLMGLYALLERNTEFQPPFPAFVVFIAFAAEAYINSVGARHIAFWDELERLPWRKKMEILHIHADHGADWSREPLQFASEVFRLRDNLAHGKPERINGPVFDTLAEAGEILSSEHLKPDWYQRINKEWVLSAKERFHTLMEYIGSLYSLHASDHLSYAFGDIRQHGD